MAPNHYEVFFYSDEGRFIGSEEIWAIDEEDSVTKARALLEEKYAPQGAGVFQTKVID